MLMAHRGKTFLKKNCFFLTYHVNFYGSCNQITQYFFAWLQHGNPMHWHWHVAKCGVSRHVFIHEQIFIKQTLRIITDHEPVHRTLLCQFFLQTHWIVINNPQPTSLLHNKTGQLFLFPLWMCNMSPTWLFKLPVSFIHQLCCGLLIVNR